MFVVSVTYTTELLQKTRNIKLTEAKDGREKCLELKLHSTSKLKLNLFISGTIRIFTSMSFIV